MPGRTILFDLDGTLIDSIPLILASFRHTVSAHGAAPVGDDRWLESIGQSLRSQLATIARDDAELEAMMATYRDHFVANHDRCVRAFPGVRDALARLRDRGVTMGIVSGKVRRGIERGLRHTGLAEFFDVLVGADDMAEHKPHPAPLRRAAEALGSTDAIYVGDAPCDMEAARRAGMQSVACLWGPFDRAALDADRYLARVPELAEL
jgi:pyrophosphatase PpaX